MSTPSPGILTSDGATHGVEPVSGSAPAKPQLDSVIRGIMMKPHECRERALD